MWGMRFVTALALASLVLLPACGGSPTEPRAQVLVVCNPSGITVTCRATGGNGADITNQVAWFSSGANGMFADPGFFVPGATGEVEIWARLDDLEAERRSAFLVSPNAPARPLTFVSGDVYDEDTNQKIAGVTIQVVEGYGVGKTTTSDRSGHYVLERVMTGEPFTLEASRIEYEPVRVSFRIDPPGNPFLDIRMKKRNH
jgi:Carboxypeptidase regulatory-like domain